MSIKKYWILTYICNLGIIIPIKSRYGGIRYMDKKLMNISISMLLLKLLEEQDMYGYEMIKELEFRSENVFSLKEGTLYPVLHGLETDGAIESYEKVAETGRMRKYYHITKNGTKLLAEKTGEWDTYQRAVHRVIGGDVYGTAAWSI